MPKFTYKAVRVRQTETGDYLVLFASPATEIDMWAGVPQKKELSDQEETTGFQREVNEKRLKDLIKFYRNERNVIQNPLLCARRETMLGNVSFDPVPSDSPDDGPIEHGTIFIEVEPLEQQSLLQLLKWVKEDLERRVPSLMTQQVPDERVFQIKQRAKLNPETNESEEAEESEPSEVESDAQKEDPSTIEDMAAVILDESHIYDFWEQVSARVQVLEELGTSFTDDNFEGFTKDAMISFLRPVVLVDGQHRLRGAIEATKSLTNEATYQLLIESKILKGEDAEVVQREIETNLSRKLPISLLMSNDPAEQVFQFVVVNQKAVPIGKALLGTIVSTSLSNEELERVSKRLTDAGIQLEESRVVAFLTRHPNSPFNGLVEKGLTSESKDLLPWSVLVSLVNIFRNLEGGRLFGSRIDYANKWRRDQLNSSGTITDYETRGVDTAYEYWRSPDGPWRDVFISFWKTVRDKLANTTDKEAKNYWGSARQSQIFNKISLTILAADFFQYLCDTKNALADVEQIPAIVDEWLDGVAPNYFTRDWNLGGVKKDSTGIRNRWAKVWVEYRKDPLRLPNTNLYRQPMTVD